MKLKKAKRKPSISKNVLRGLWIVSLVFLLQLSLSSANEIKKSLFHWEFAGWCGGGFYPNIEFDLNCPGRLYLVSDVAGIWKSDNLAESWIPLNNGLDNLILGFIKIAPSDSDILYAGSAAGLFCSKNQGKSWKLCDTNGGKISFIRPDNYRSLAVSKKNPGELIAGTKKGEIYLSGNFGTQWQHLELPKDLFKEKTAVSVLQFSEDETGFYAALGEKFYYYSMEDKLWKLLKHSSGKITDFFISGDKIPAIYLAGAEFLSISKDGGKSWFSSSKVPRGIIYRLAVFTLKKSEVIAAVWNKGWHGGIYLSRDGGKSWEDGNLAFDKRLNPTRLWTGPDEKFVSLKADPFTSGVLLATSAWGVFRSDDGGRSWQEKITGAPNTVGSDIHITSGGEIYVATMDNGLLKSRNGGKTYQPLFPKKGYRKDINGHIWRVVTNPRRPKIVIATSSPWNEDINQVIISRDGGKNFIAVRKGLPDRRPKVNTMWGEGYPRALAIDPQHPWIVYLGIDGDDGGGLFVSHDAGWHWKHLKVQPDSKRIYNALAVDPTNSDRLLWGAYGKNGGIYISEDKGKSWRCAFKEMRKIFDLAVTPDGWIYAAGDFNGPAVFISRDQGKNWSLLKKFPGEGAAEALFIHPEKPGRVAVSTVRWYGGAGGKIYGTEDGGKIWRDITGDLPPGAGAAAMAYNPNDSHLYIVRYAGSVYKTKL